ncbi:MAG: DNA replication protein [Micavibrio sp.]|nr:DNA replication protein [Micavibrio sp.]|tara:strand:+ start:697 stop:1392 length:696 start_codon:yes stop_codon:yes gene_type:complete
MQSQKNTQIPLDLGHRTAFGRENFLVTESNSEAVAWVDKWPAWPTPVTILYGPAASGKSHLLSVWCDKTNASSISPHVVADYSRTQLERKKITPVAVDRADFLIGDIEGERGLFHLYNAVKESGATMMMTSCVPPSELDFVLPDLSSRLRAAQTVRINPPDDTLLSAVLVKLFADRQLKVSTDVIRYLVPRMERSLDAAVKLVADADKLALSEKKAITVPLVRQILMKNLG